MNNDVISDFVSKDETLRGIQHDCVLPYSPWFSLVIKFLIDVENTICIIYVID